MDNRDDLKQLFCKVDLVLIVTESRELMRCCRGQKGLA